MKPVLPSAGIWLSRALRFRRRPLLRGIPILGDQKTRACEGDPLARRAHDDRLVAHRFRPSVRPRRSGVALRRRMRSGARALAWGAGGLLALFVGCRTATANRPASASSLNGRASYEAVLEPASGTSELGAQREYIPAIPVGDNLVPAYPEQLLGLNLPPQKIVLRLVLDERGDIVAIRPSEIPSEADARYRNEFEAAI